MDRKRSFTLKELASFTGSKLIGNADHKITGVADLESATSTDVSFLAKGQHNQAVRYESAMRSSQAGVIFISPEVSPTSGKNYLVVDNPSEAFQKTLEALFGHYLTETTGFEAIHPSAVIHPTATIGARVTIGPFAVIEKSAHIGSDSTIGAHCFIGYEAHIGSHTLIHPHVTVRERCVVGNHVILQPGVVIGACGFGYLTDARGKHTKLNQIGNVILEDHVEIGANTTIDRARFQSTIIRSGTKIDNLVQIGHGAHIGHDNIIISQTAIAGSTSTGKHVIIAGQCAIAGHLKICDHVMIAGKSGVTKSIDQPGKYGGIPIMPLTKHNRNSVYLRTIDKYIKRIEELEKHLL